MAAEHSDSAPETVSCTVCHHEVPRADALTVEGQEYLYFFCGQGCYAQWHDGQQRQGSAEKAN